MKTVVIKFRKTTKFRNAYPFDDVYSCITGGSIMNIAINLAHSLEGYVKSFREKDPYDVLKCKIVIRIPEEKETVFISGFIKALNGSIENIKW